jgi:subtilisin family serine protease
MKKAFTPSSHAHQDSVAGRRAAPSLESLERRTLFAIVAPNDPFYPLQTWLSQMSVPQAWDLTTGSSKVVVNVNDSGIDYTHPDLYKNIWLNQKEIPFAVGKKGLSDTDADGLITFWDLNARSGSGKLVNGAFAGDLNANGYIDAGDVLNDPRWENGVDDGGNGHVDDLVGWDFLNNDNDPMDEFEHGTFCAGIIGAETNNAEGGAGVAWRVQLMATKGHDRQWTGQGLENMEVGLRYAADNGARVSNNSWGVSNLNEQKFTMLYDAVDYARAKDMLVVAIAHNNGDDNDIPGLYQMLPASFDLPNVISVAASTADDQLASFSNYGQVTVDLAAPGVNIGSTVPLAVAQDPSLPYELRSGTSVAGPFVVGAAALVLAGNASLSAAQVRGVILDNVDPLPAFTHTTASGGRLNVYKAVSAVPSPGGGGGGGGAGIATSSTSPFSTAAVAPPSSADWLATKDELLL